MQRFRLPVLSLLASFTLAAPTWLIHAQTATAPTTPAPASPSLNLAPSLRAELEKWLATSGAPGITAACLLSDGAVITASAGLARKSPATLMPADARMLAGSTGKTFCAAVMLQLVEEGRAKLDDPISTWLGDLPWFDRLPNARAITLRMLMNHSSGIPEHVQLPEFSKAIASDPQRAWKPDELVAFILDKPAACEPGKGWSYADTNYILVAMIIEKITGTRFYDEANDRFIKPLHLNATAPSDTPKLPGLVSGYVGPDNPFPVPAEVAVDGVYAINPQFEWTGGGYCSSSPDLARWALELWSGHVLKPETMTEMFKGVKAKTGPKDEYGLGVQMWPSRHGPVRAHTGWFPGYITLMAYYPDKNAAVALQINTDIGPQIKGHRALADQILETCEKSAR